MHTDTDKTPIMHHIFLPQNTQTPIHLCRCTHAQIYTSTRVYTCAQNMLTNYYLFILNTNTYRFIPIHTCKHNIHMPTYQPYMYGYVYISTFLLCIYTHRHTSTYFPIHISTYVKVCISQIEHVHMHKYVYPLKCQTDITHTYKHLHTHMHTHRHTGYVPNSECLCEDSQELPLLGSSVTSLQ